MAVPTFASLANPTAGFYERSQAQMAALREQAETLQLQVSSGERLERSSDDPIASARLRSLARAERLSEIDTSIASRARDDLTSASDNLSDIADALIRARELALQAGSGSTSDEGYLAIAEELDVLRDSILASINATRSTGRALFGGEASAPAYTLDSAGNASYAGTASAGTLPIAPGVDIEHGITGPAALEFAVGGSPTDALAYLRTLAEGLRGAAADPAAFARDAVSGIDAAIDTASRSQAVLGARLAWIDTLDTAQQLRSEARQAEAGEIGGTDLASAITQLQQVLTVLEASQAGFGRLSALTLFDRI